MSVPRLGLRAKQPTEAGLRGLLAVSSPSTCRSYREVRRAADSVGAV
jgi:hypothetical protein